MRDAKKMDWRHRISAKGYGWYLALKISKAMLAIPMFPLYVLAMLGLAALLGLWYASRGLFWEFPRHMAASVADYWTWNWFRNFDRRFWHRKFVWEATATIRHEEATDGGR